MLAFAFGSQPAVAGNGHKTAIKINCSHPGQSIQQAVDRVESGRALTVFVTGVCHEHVVIRRDDITLSGNESGAACDRSSPGGSGTIVGSVTIDAARARIEHLTVTGAGPGVDVINRANAHLECNSIDNNEKTGVTVLRASNAVLRNNSLSGNGTRTADPRIFFDCGLFAADASSVDSRGNTYADNQYCAVGVDRQSAFRNGAFLPREPGHPANPDERDTVIERGCDPQTGTGCFTTDFAPLAIEIFNGGLVEFRNADIHGEVEVAGLSSFRISDDGAMQGNIHNEVGSLVRLKDRSQFGDRSVTFTGKLECSGNSQTLFSSVECGQTCNGPIPGSCL